jgi:hypothetical protein
MSLRIPRTGNGNEPPEISTAAWQIEVKNVLNGEIPEACGAPYDQQGWQVNVVESECKVVKIVRGFLP